MLGGVPFMAQNDISVRPAKHQIILGDNTSITYPHSYQEQPVIRQTALLLTQTGSHQLVLPHSHLRYLSPPLPIMHVPQPRTLTSQTTLMIVWTPSYKQFFLSTNGEFQSVFITNDKVCSGKSGPIKYIVDIGTVLPPRRKGNMPSYGRNVWLSWVQIWRPRETGRFCPAWGHWGVHRVSQPLSPPQQALWWHQIGPYIAFSDVSRYCKPQPSHLPVVDSTLRTIAGWNWLIQTELKSASYQIPLDRNSMKYWQPYFAAPMFTSIVPWGYVDLGPY